jgi:predicted phage tail component-like protein
MAYSVSFNGYVLQNSSFRTRIIQHTNIPQKMVQTEPKARDSGATIVDVRYGARTIEVDGMLTSTDRNTLVGIIDTMKLNLKDASGTLDIDYGNSTRRYYATVTDLQLPEDFYNISQVPYKVTFICADPFGYATTSGNLSFTSQTAMLLDTVITMSGSIDSDPVVQLTVNTSTAFSLLTVSNENTGEAIVVSKPGGNFANSDVIIIDSRRKLVQINGSGIDYTGQFPKLTVTTSPRLRVAITATAINYGLVINYSPRYL